MTTSTDSHRVAMWSPPRARSTMMMRVFEALGCAVFDEPFYPYWLKATNRTDDPGFEKTIAHHETDWREIVRLVLGPVPDGRDWYYQKHMAIHMLPEVDLSWMQEVRNCFLVRHPADVIVSMSEFRALVPTSDADIEDAARLVGIPQLKRIFDLAQAHSAGPPPVIDADDVLRDPATVLGRFCDRIGLPFDPARPLTWAEGRHPYDGAWADDWYDKVYRTSRLGPFQPKNVSVPDELQPVLDYCLPTYEYIAQHRIC